MRYLLRSAMALPVVTVALVPGTLNSILEWRGVVIASAPTSWLRRICESKHRPAAVDA